MEEEKIEEMKVEEEEGDRQDKEEEKVEEMKEDKEKEEEKEKPMPLFNAWPYACPDNTITYQQLLEHRILGDCLQNWARDVAYEERVLEALQIQEFYGSYPWRNPNPSPYPYPNPTPTGEDINGRVQSWEIQELLKNSFSSG